MSEEVPGSQLAHSARPLVAAKLPLAHGVCCVEPVVATWPGEATGVGTVEMVVARAVAAAVAAEAADAEATEAAEAAPKTKKLRVRQRACCHPRARPRQHRP